MIGTVETCPQCGWTFDIEALQANTCKKCRSAILITSVAYLEKFDRPAIQKYIARNSEILKGDAEDQDALLSMGLCYLRLGLYETADKYLGRLIDAHPEVASGYYYKAIGCMKGRRPRVLTLNTVRTAEQLLLTAMTLEPDNGRHDAVLAAMRHDYYVVNGLRVPNPSPAELLEGARGKHFDRNEIAQGLALMSIPEASLGAAIFAKQN
ncbi:MAG TPA: tetratricopeptide repeat protein [Edaphobacter sp.]|uniref:tetratricopeptide repeat protein n=1 Tax=Edaphobacter sp. TaxID=1934404 RepID=UPI002BD39A3F|nr:tetratricopeptide repeat protein [Edaphobacter sp.]HUZ93623.1 tetratricopeptide repeat protein [Edaphobacter sp.]